MRRLVLGDYRSYPALDLVLSGAPVVLAGQNGAGKTNLLEALSFFTPGRGFRRAELADCARDAGGGGWAVSVEVEDEAREVAAVQLGTGLEPSRTPVDLANGQTATLRLALATQAATP